MLIRWLKIRQRIRTESCSLAVQSETAVPLSRLLARGGAAVVNLDSCQLQWGPSFMVKKGIKMSIENTTAV